MKLKSKIFIISLILIILLSVSFAGAAQNDTLASDDGEVLTSTEEEIQTESFDDNLSASNQDVLSENERTYNDLQQRVDIAKDTGATIILEHDYRYAGEGDNGHISITGNTIIDGKNHYISGNGEKSVFRFDDCENGVTLTLKNIIFKNGRSDNGGVIHTKMNVDINIINCTFIDNSAGEDGGAIYFDSTGTLNVKDSRFERCIVDISDEASKKHNGGAINVHGDLIIDNSIFRSNVAGFGYGGAVYVEGKCKGITNSIFENNTARSRFGGAVHIEGDSGNGLVVDNCSFTNNTGFAIDKKSVCGGAISYEGSGLVVLTNSNFTNNVLMGLPNSNKDKYQASRTLYDSRGGAVYAVTDMQIGNCIFIKNHAMDHGGAVYTKEGIRWLENQPSIFINNSGGYANFKVANKGGAVYASRFNSVAKELVFIDNYCWYGGAVYINNKDDVTFESCVFINNYVKNSDGKSSPGSAIYIDSSSSKLSLINNIFYNNHGTEDKGVYNCGVYGTVKNNWYGINDVNFDDAYLIEWHRVAKNEKISDSNSLRITLESNATEVFHDSVKLTLKFVCSDKTEFTGKLINWTVDFKSNNNGKFSDLKIGDNEATVIFTPEAGDTVVTAKVHGQEVSITLKQMGDFTWLQQQVDATPSGGVLNLTRNLTYNPDVEMALNGGIKITKPITINGNGYTISGSNLARVFSVHSNDVKINNITFVNGFCIKYLDESGGAIFIDGVKNVNVTNSRFMNNRAELNGGAIGIRNADSIQILNSQFIGNSAKYGGAVNIKANNVTIDRCEFRSNSAYDDINLNAAGGAIFNDEGKNLTITNSLFLNNKAHSYELLEDVSDNKLTFTLVGRENYINAIWSVYGDVKFTNVTYWDGKITTGDNPVYSDNESGQNFTLEIFNNETKLIKKVILVTDIDGQATYDFSNLENGNYTYNVKHFDDAYYDEIWSEGEFNLTKINLEPSEVKINITDGKEFKWGECNISFEVTNRTTVDVLITNEEESFYFEVKGTDLNYVILDLPASDKEYYICVYNYANDTFDASVDYKTFKIMKVNSTVPVINVTDVDYGKNVSVNFTGDEDSASYNVTVYDKNKNVVFSKIINETAIDISNLPAGEYNVTVVNLGNTNKTQSNASKAFKVNKVNNNIKVEVTDGVYGKDITVTVTADIDGDYIVYLNTKPVTVYVEDGKGSTTINDLGAGNYNANVTFDNVNYNNNATNTTFTIQKGQSHVKIVDLDENIAWNTSKNIRFSDFYPAEYIVTIHDSGNNRIFYNLTDSILFTIPALDVGQYKLTVTNIGNDNVILSQDSRIFEVVKDNHVEVFAEDSDYGREVLIAIIADVDGYYTVNLNGTEVTIEVVDGEGLYYDLLDLNAGNYTTKVIFDNPDYTTTVNNTNFTIYPVESNLQIYEIGNVTYGGDIHIKFYDDYPTTFYIEVKNENNTVEFNTTFEYTDKRKDMTVIYAGLEVGEYMVAITNRGNENVIGNSSCIYFNVTELPGSIVTSDLSRVYNSGMDFTAKLVDENGTGIANTTVTFIIKGKSYTAVTDANGVANINPKLAVGTYTVEVVNPFNNVKTTKTLKIVTRITGNKNVKTYYGKNYKYKLRIIGDNGKAVGAGVAVKVTINGKAKTLKTDKNGYITVKFTKKYLPKTYKVSAEYKGIKVSNKIKVKKVLKLKKVKVKRSAKKLVLKATLKEGKKALKGKKVVFKFKGKKYKAKTNKKGVAKVKVKKNVLKKLKKGKKVKYQVTYLKHTVKRTAKVKR